MSRINLCYATYRLDTQTVAPTLPGFQGIKRFVQYLDSHPHKPIFNPSNYYVGSNFTRLKWSGNQVEDHTKKIALNVIKMQIVPELSTEYGQFRVLSILCLVLLYARKYRFNQL